MKSTISLILNLFFVLFKFFAVVFFIFVVFDGMARTIFSSPTFMAKEYTIVRKYQDDNFVILNGFSYRKDVNYQSLTLGYTIFSYAFKHPKKLIISSGKDKVESTVQDNILSIIFSLSYMLFGGFLLFRFFNKFVKGPKLKTDWL